jgi:hypothetical protein
MDLGALERITEREIGIVILIVFAFGLFVWWQLTRSNNAVKMRDLELTHQRETTRQQAADTATREFQAQQLALENERIKAHDEIELDLQRERIKLDRRTLEALERLASGAAADERIREAQITTTQQLLQVLRTAQTQMTAFATNTTNSLTAIHADVKVVPRETMKLATPSIDDVKTYLITMEARLLERMGDANGACEVLQQAMRDIGARLENIDGFLRMQVPEPIEQMTDQTPNERENNDV